MGNILRSLTIMRAAANTPVPPDYVDMAGDAYNWMMREFGSPCDPGWPYEISFGIESAFGRDPVRRLYSISLAVSLPSPSRVRGAIAHEMCHRFLHRRDRAIRAPWLKEAVIETAARRYMRHAGEDSWVGDRLRAAHASPRRLSIAELSLVRRMPWFLNPSRSMYPKGFGETIIIVGETLEETVGWDNVRSAVRFGTTEEWIRSMPECKQRCVREILGLR